MDYQSVGVNLQDQEMFNVKLQMKMPWLGGFAGAFDVGGNYLVSGCDGVGTKIQLYLENKEQSGVEIGNLGQDLVAMVFNDIVCTGAKPLFMNDYLAVHDLKDTEYMDLIDGINKGLTQCGDAPVPLISGETAIMPSMVKKGQFDIAGFGVGVIAKEDFIDGTKCNVGDMMIGLKSSGFHSNGYTLIREIWNGRLRNPDYKGDGKKYLPLLLKPTRIYVKSILDVLSRFREDVHGIAHITGGGRDNVLRILGENLNLRPKWRNDWLRPAEFKWIKDMGNISDEEMKRVFNDGIGMVLVVNRDSAPKISELLKILGEEPLLIGEIEERLDLPTLNKVIAERDSESYVKVLPTKEQEN